MNGLTTETGSPGMGKNRSWTSSMETHHGYLATCWSHSFACKYVELGIYWDSPRTTIRIQYVKFLTFTFRVGILYLLSGLGGSILSSLFIQNNISVGASGALFGLLGAMLSELLTNWTIYTDKAAALITLIVIIVINLAVGILPHVDNFAHIGGFLTGFLLGFVLLLRPQFGWIERRHLPANSRAVPKHKLYQYILCFVALALLIVGFTMGLVMLFRGENGNNHCSWCHYLSCVPTSKWECGN
ncbi:RHOMBOID-like protein 2 [Cucumis melo var. makuwa]|uniref:RHOMBOID-like protein n=1 Tax=Cucumis melo var. makuwa TaxID=1194695 RepID=A0A5D3D788_CUCMM|nr:RHOMBOID-like protein 2 [Cucumis melo var. makuwa]